MPTTAPTIPPSPDLVRCDNCGRYGWHETEKCPDAPDIAPPPGAEADVWDDAGRDIYQLSGTVIASDDFMKCPLVSAVARQRLDGRLADVAVEVDDAGRQPLTSAQARELAGYLTEAADLIDRWAGVETAASTAELLTNAFAILRTAWSVLSTAPGNADSYVQAAMDSITDAQEVLR
jgi:hypothetical protein